MKAIQIKANGGPEVLELVDLLEPSPKNNQIKVKVLATSLNHMDIWVRQGIPGMGKLPLILGCDAVGDVVELGDAVTRFKVGDRVVLFPLKGCGACDACDRNEVNFCRQFQIYGEHIHGTHQEFLCLDESCFEPLNAEIPVEKAAAFPLVYLTAWHMLIYNGWIREKQTVLVIGAASGVGSAAVQIAKSFGCEVIATAGSNDKLQCAKKDGADHLINHYEDSISNRVKEITNKKGVDVIFEHVGKAVWDDCLKSLAWGGRLVTCGATSGPKVEMDLRHIFIKQQQIIGSTMGNRAEFNKICLKINAGDFNPAIAKVFRPDEIQAAHRFLESSQNYGKVILSWGASGTS